MVKIFRDIGLLRELYLCEPRGPRFVGWGGVGKMSAETEFYEQMAATVPFYRVAMGPPPRIKWKFRRKHRYALGAALSGVGLLFSCVSPAPIALPISLAPIFVAVSASRLIGGVAAARIAAGVATLITAYVALPAFLSWNDGVTVWVTGYLLGLVGFAFNDFSEA